MKLLSLIVCLTSYGICLNAQSKQAFETAASKAFNNEDYSTALNFFLSAIEYNENDAMNLYYAGECNRRLFEYNTAIAWYNKSLASDQTNTLVYYRLAETRLASGDAEGAMKVINERLKNSPSGSSMLHDLIIKIDSAKAIMSATQGFRLDDAGRNVNTAFSDFAAFPVNDSLLFFSSLRFETGSAKNKEYVSKILSARFDSAGIDRAAELKASINNPSWHNCNSSVSPDGRLMLFSRCNYDENKKLICSLYESEKKNGEWQLPVRLSDAINKSPFTSTQPSIAIDNAAGYRLYFVSDRSEGYGQTDIYTSFRNAEGVYSAPVNCGPAINTAGKEVTPYYNSITGHLYFSSDSLYGLGGFDIYKIRPTDSLSSPVNAGQPFNSGYNDLYYAELLNDPASGFLSSNRPGSKELNGSRCCYDIYRFEKKEEEKLTATIPLEQIPVRQQEIDRPMDLVVELKQHLPLKLYFDNDFPDPSSRKKTTKADYSKLYHDYSAKLEQYIMGFSVNDSKSGEASRDSVEKFFISELQFNYNRLSRFTELLQKVLGEGKIVTLNIRGYASPLAESSYNLILSARRINSLYNYWQSHGTILKYIQDGQLIINEEPSGERIDSAVSDNKKDMANSVYSPSAARERRIEVVSLSIQP